jgi:hypothetical protein
VRLVDGTGRHPTSSIPGGAGIGDRLLGDTIGVTSPTSRNADTMPRRFYCAPSSPAADAGERGAS